MAAQQHKTSSALIKAVFVATDPDRPVKVHDKEGNYLFDASIDDLSQGNVELHGRTVSVMRTRDGMFVLQDDGDRYSIYPLVIH